MVQFQARYMMATKAIYKLGNISRDTPDLCSVHEEDKENYIGNWITGFGFVEVKFPKNTTRELTDEEKDKYNGKQFVIGSGPAFRIWTKEPDPKSIPKESPMITLPDDQEKKKQLKSKLREYKKRMDPYRPPELQMDTICKITVLETPLKDGQVKIWELLVGTRSRPFLFTNLLTWLKKITPT